MESIRAGLVAAPQAAIGVDAEVALLRLVGDKAKRIATGENTVMGRLAKDVTTDAISGAIEATSEVAQEGIAITNRTLLDDNFSQQEARLRLGEEGFQRFSVVERW